MSNHRQTGLVWGLTEEQIDDIATWRESKLFSDLERQILEYSEQLTARSTCSPELAKSLRDELGVERLIELNLTIGFANMSNRYSEGLGIVPGEDPGTPMEV